MNQFLAFVFWIIATAGNFLIQVEWLAVVVVIVFGVAGWLALAWD